MRFLRVLVLVLSLGSVFAEDIKVFRDEYLIKSNVLGASLNESLNSVGGQLLAKLDNGVSLVSPKVSAASTSEQGKIVNYDPNNDYCQQLLKAGVAKLCSPNYEVKVNLTSNDPYNGQAWGLGVNGIQADSAWDTTTGSSSVVVAVIDSGVDYNHVDLAANMWVNPYEVRNGIDDDGNGYIDDIHGADTINNTGDPMDQFFHGTHCAGTIAAVGNNGLGVAGVSWNAKIMALRFLDENGSGGTYGAVKAIDYMIAMKKKGINVKISSNSWGGPGESDILADAVRRADAEGIIFVAAAGNDYGSDNDTVANYPSSVDSDNVVSVAAIDSNKNLAGFSNIGYNTVDIAAPGVGILSTIPGNGYKTENGTSMATPHVSGALALLAGLHPEMTSKQLIQRLYESAVPLPSLSGLIKTGRALNAYRMVTNQTIPLDTSVNKNYEVNEVGYSPDTSADGQSSVINADEATYETVNLPFSFPYGQFSTRQITVSPNGVLYFNGQPDKWDFKSSSLAPIHSIAAFHTDLDTITGGVKVKVSNDRLTVYWKATHFRYKDLGFIEVRTTLYANGVVRTFVKTPTSASSLFSLGTIGITFADSSNAQALKASHNLYGVQFTPVGTNPVVPPAAGINVSSVKVGVSKTKGFRSSKEQLKLSVLGTGKGDIVVRAKFDGLACETAKAVSFSNGSKLSAGLSTTIKRFKNLSITVNGLTSTTRVGSGKSKAKKTYLRSACRQLYAGLK